MFAGRQAALQKPGTDRVAADRHGIPYCILLVMQGDPISQRPEEQRHPYKGLANWAFWQRSVGGVAPFAVDPVITVPFTIGQTDRIATGGSCFAQNIARGLRERHFNYFVAETAPPTLPTAKWHEYNYGTFSARYGNIYTARHLRQLFDRAYDKFTPSLRSWNGPGGEWIDPFRPRIQPGGFGSETELLEDRRQHLACTRRLFEELDVFIFTLGLTEGWEHAGDGAAIPLAPGVAGGTWEPAHYYFRNYSVMEVERDLAAFIEKLRSVNPRCRIILTVSPVPLVATYENRHVLESTCLSKAVLRVAAANCVNSLENIAYFPAYEIVTGPHAGGRYFEDDLRSVTRAGVDHVMRCFFSHYTAEWETASSQHGEPLSDMNSELAALDKIMKAEIAALSDVVCDEEALQP